MENLVAIALIAIALLALSKHDVLITKNTTLLAEYDLAINEVKSEISRISLLDSDTNVDRTITNYYKFSGAPTTVDDSANISLTTTTTTSGDNITISCSRGSKTLFSKVYKRIKKGQR